PEWCRELRVEASAASGRELPARALGEPPAAPAAPVLERLVWCSRPWARVRQFLPTTRLSI
ncbi:MAG: hypothetical protein WCA11_09860, partial [Terracidiphilus sp.]